MSSGRVKPYRWVKLLATDVGDWEDHTPVRCGNCQVMVRYEQLMHIGPRNEIVAPICDTCYQDTEKLAHYEKYYVDLDF